MKIVYILAFLTIFSSAFGQQASITGQVIEGESQTPVNGVTVYLVEKEKTFSTDSDGHFKLKNLKAGTYEIIFFKEEYLTLSQTFTVRANEKLKATIQLAKLNYLLDAIEVKESETEKFGLRNLRNVEGYAIYAAKKSEVINLENMVANLATNNPRQVYKGIAGLNIWESDGAGLQLGIGARGLDPNRTSNFNTRQNGYDISADALGYPESYYTPPTQALKRIEIVRGAASLQYGSQFGGLLNFIFKEGNAEKSIEFFSENTVGSFGLINSFNSIGGTKGDVNYYAFYQRKQGNGYRPNSKFSQNTAYASIRKHFSKNFSIGLEYTFMDYLAQQSGGLQDFEFKQDPRQSKRERNWFKVNWNLAALNVDYKFNDKTKINSRSFVLHAQRDALGELGPINRPDPMRERDLIRGKFQNFGNETRLLTRYHIKGRISTFLIGTRYYQGFTTNEQGDADDGSDADFTFLNPDDLERSAYEFPSQNFSLFAENLFTINQKLSFTPGVRYEYIKTASDGFYKERVFSGGQVIFEQKFEDKALNQRNIFLLGLGLGYKAGENIELYGNFSQNYRSINFSDLAVVNPNFIVDSLLSDESGYNADIGIRGSALDNTVKFDASLFFLRYDNRIGISEIIVPDPVSIEKAVAYRTNIGDARIIGLEAYTELDLLKLLKREKDDVNLTLFTNFSLLKGKYLSGGNAVIGNKVELIPPISFKSGVNFFWNNFKASYQYSYVQEHFSDATNATYVVDATRGLIPSYQVHDFSVSYNWKRFNLQSGVNNLLNESYFTRRAAAYPGPGIIPADGRSVYLTFSVKI